MADWGTVTVGIKAADVNGKPTGAYLTSATFLATDLGLTDANKEWKYIQFAAVELNADTEYCLVVDHDGDIGYYCSWRENSGAGYTRGQGWYSDDNGASWNATAADFMFRIRCIPK